MFNIIIILDETRILKYTEENIKKQKSLKEEGKAAKKSVGTPGRKSSTTDKGEQIDTTNICLFNLIFFLPGSTIYFRVQPIISTLSGNRKSLGFFLQQVGFAPTTFGSRVNALDH